MTDAARRALIAHVIEVQSTIRTCEACGECCTDQRNTMRILPVEAERIAAHLRGPMKDRREEFVRRMKATVARYSLKPGQGKKRYTCSFLEEDLTCALPFDVKPVGCLGFNPVDVDFCDMDGEKSAPAFAAEQALNTNDGFVDSRAPIPYGVLAALDGRLPKAPSVPEPVRPPAPRRAVPLAPPSTVLRRDALPRLLSKMGVASRKAAEQMVKDGRVTVNGVPRKDVLFKADPSKDRVALDGKPVGSSRPAPVYVVAHKPRGQVTTASDPEGRETVMELVTEFQAPGLAPVGRLDRASAGLLLFTNDHDLADRLLDPQFHVAKEYHVKVRGELNDAMLRRLRTETVRDGVDEFPPLKVDVEERGPKSVRLKIILREGKNRQIRRHLAAFGYETESLVRTSFGPLMLGNLEPGGARKLTEKEIVALRAAAGGVGTFEV